MAAVTTDRFLDALQSYSAFRISEYLEARVRVHDVQKASSKTMGAAIGTLELLKEENQKAIQQGKEREYGSTLGSKTGKLVDQVCDTVEQLCDLSFHEYLSTKAVLERSFTLIEAAETPLELERVAEEVNRAWKELLVARESIFNKTRKKEAEAERERLERRVNQHKQLIQSRIEPTQPVPTEAAPQPLFVAPPSQRAPSLAALVRENHFPSASGQ